MTALGRIARMTGSLVPAALARPFGAPTAVLFHGVERTIADPAIQGSQHALDAFETIARLLKRDFDVLPLDALADVLKRPERHPRAVFLTSDDGYANTLTLAADVLSAFGLPWTLFVSTHHIDTGALIPPTAVRIFFQHARAGRYAIPYLGHVELGAQPERLEAAGATLRSLKRMAAPKADEAVAVMMGVLAVHGVGEPGALYPSERLLSWDQLRELKKRGVEIGAHADTHWPMHDDQSGDWLTLQATRPKARIEAEIGPCRFFAYPFGQDRDVGRRAWQAVRDAGYANAFTTHSGSLDASANPFLMPRYGLAPQESNLAAFLPVLRANNARLRQWQSRIGT